MVSFFSATVAQRFVVLYQLSATLTAVILALCFEELFTVVSVGGKLAKLFMLSQSVFSCLSAHFKLVSKFANSPPFGVGLLAVGL